MLLFCLISYLFCDSTLGLAKNVMNEWNTSTLWYIDWRVLLLFIVIIFSDGFLPLSRLIIPNPHGMFKLEKRKMIFQGNNGRYTRSLILKEKVVNNVFEVFVLFLLMFNMIIILFMFLRFTGR
jgi:hypothetical protein